MNDPIKTRLATLKQDWRDCTRCGLHEIRGEHDVVLARGIPKDLDSVKYYILVDAPDENILQGGFLYGDTGTLLQELLDLANIPLGECFFSSTVACRPWHLVDNGEIKDRAPSREEIETCSPRIQSEIYCIDPYLIFTFGDVAWGAIVQGRDREGKKKVAGAQGDLKVARIPGITSTLVYPVIGMMALKTILLSGSVAAHAPLATTVRAVKRGAYYVNQQIQLENEE